MTTTPENEQARLPQRDANDIRWFWSEAPGILGAQGINPEPDAPRTSKTNAGTEDTRIAEAAERYQRIDDVLSTLSVRHQRVLQRFYQDAVWKGLEAFGPLAGVAMVSESAKTAYRADRTTERAIQSHFIAWLHALSARTMPGMHCSPDDRSMKRAIHIECDRLIAAACRAYEASKLQLDRQRRLDRECRQALRLRGSAVACVEPLIGVDDD